MQSKAKLTLMLHFCTFFILRFVTTLISLQTTGKKWHKTNTPPEIDKSDTHKNCCLTKMEKKKKKCSKVTFANDRAE